jgi:formate hydrogenlyase subunit 3/multisubunit Na+/H+ antiporter MnhD subunit
MTRHYRSAELYPVIMGGYLLGIITAFLGVQFRLGDAGLVFSLVYLLLAILYIVYGISYIYQKVSNRMGEAIIKKDVEEKV